MNVIFLDIDGVINTENNIVFRKETGNRIMDKDGYVFDPVAVGFLKLLIDKTDAKIVISSSWRHFGLQFFKDLWIEREMPGEVIDLTFSKETTKRDEQRIELQKIPEGQGISRGDEINAYLATHPEITNYVILDDDTDFYENQNFVQTDLVHGLDCNSYYNALEIFMHEY